MFGRLRAVVIRLRTIRAVTPAFLVASMCLGLAVSTADASPNWTFAVAGDFTGTGRSSIAQFESTTGQWWVRASTGSSFTSSLWTTWSPAVTWGPVLAGDFNGDGKTDIAGFNANLGQWWVGLSNGSAFTNTLWTTWNSSVTWDPILAGDFNGDGKTDIAGFNASLGQWWVGLSNGSAFTSTLWTSWSTAVTWGPVLEEDFDGDGRTDIAGFAASQGQWWVGLSNGSAFTNTLWTSWSTAVTWGPVLAGDFDGDGKTDIAGFAASQGQWWVGLSNGSAFTSTVWTTWSTAVTWGPVVAGDFNGDGKADIAGFIASLGQWWVGLSNGSAFTSSLWTSWSPSVTWGPALAGDFNGDGKTDIAGFIASLGQWWVGRSTGTSFVNGLWSSVAGTCGGQTVSCDDGDPCTVDGCNPDTGSCVFTPVSCDDGNPCTTDTCSTAVGGCVYTPLPAGSTCDDNNLCTIGDSCQTDPFSGAPRCTSTPVNCDDGDACTMDSCEATTGGCRHVPIGLAEVPSLQFSSGTSMNWPSVSGASFYNTYRGTIPSHGLGSRPPAGPLYDQTCFEYDDAHADGAQVSTDTAAPPAGTAFYYLVSEETGCGESSIGSDWNGTPIPNTSSCSNPAPPRLVIMKSHSGSFMQGQTGATYTLIVSNTGTGPTFGTVTVEDMVPSGLTLVSMAGTGWTCVPGGDTCTRSDALGPGAAYPPITVTVNVASNATSPQVNQAEASGGGAGFASTSDSTTITPVAPALSIVKSHTGHFHRGQTGATYTVTVSNTGNATTSGTVTVTDTAPVGLVNVTMAGTGWTCPTPGSTCTRSDALAPGASYPDITVTVDVTPDAPLPTLTNQVTASGGGSVSATANDPTTIDYPLLALLKSHTGNFVQGQQGATYTLSVQDQGFGPTVGTVTVTEVTPSGLTLVSMSGTGWTCPVSPGNVCTRSDSLASTAFYPPITVTVNVAPAAPSSLTNEADISGGGSIGTGKGFDFTSIDTARIVLGIIKTHSGSFIQGQQGATYTLSVKNNGNVATSGTVTVTENPPTGLTLVSMAGTGWTCPTSPGNVCTRSDALAPGASYPDITVTVNVAPNAPSSVDNQATVTGGGDATLHTADDPTTINLGPPVLSVTKTHGANFSQGQTNATYTVTITNIASQTTAGPVNMNEMPPSGLTVVSMAGTGWTCDPVQCNRNDPLPGGASYPPITITVSVAATASSPQVNQVMVNGGGSPPAMASDSTTIIPAGVPSLSITKTHAGSFHQGQTNAIYTLIVSNNIGAGTTTGPVNVDEFPPSGLALVSMAGTGWTCSPIHCSRTTALAPGASYPAITVTVNVAAAATSPQVNQARVSGGGSAPNTTSDPTVITP